MTEKLSSRQSGVIRRIRELSRDGAARRKESVFLCDGEKLLQEALRSGAEPVCVLWKGQRLPGYPDFTEEYLLSDELYDYVSPMKNSPGPLFTVRLPEENPVSELRSAIVLEGVQDPGNVGTVLRTADAFGVDAVILLEGCADCYAPKTVRAGMGAVFRQRVLHMDRTEVAGYCHAAGLRLYGAALTDKAADLRTVPLGRTAVAIGSEGRGLSRELLACCDGELIIPMSGEAESLNAAVAAAIVMWEMRR
ncbi:MAG: RNA methyltransferase [Oscillospiraceae bacterium]|nr:RNA methyltransferase [Oscillospiraceae bacterium]